jgi:uncharacterized protein YndB with AHSA1/START domain
MAMITVSRSIHIDAPVERVFALMADPAARARLNPVTQPICVETEDGGALRAGSTIHFRLQSGHRIVDYRTRVYEFDPPRRIVSVSETAIPFRIEIETASEDGGARVTQTESFEPTAVMLAEMPSENEAGAIMRLAYRLALFLDLETARRFQRRQEELLEQKLGQNLERWLEAIKRRLEAKPG